MFYRGKSKAFFEFLTAILLLFFLLATMPGCAHMTEEEKKDMMLVIGVGVAAGVIANSLDDDNECINRDPLYPRCDP